ncbi:MAG TPA: NAD(P)-binding domain-containing protein, partial [Gemmatimonadaceae bacterium]
GNHTVTFGIRGEPDEQLRQYMDTSGGAARATTPIEAARGAEVVVLATPWKETHDAVQQLGDLSGKIVIDCTNPFKPGLTGLDVPADSSGAAQVASWAPGSRVVKAFNTTGFNIMANPKFADGAAAMFYCGDDVPAKRVVDALATELGFAPVDAGPLTVARQLESLGLLWVGLAIGSDLGREIAFRLLRRPPVQ